MNRLLEYISLIPSAWENKEKIVEGMINNVRLNHGTLLQEEQDEIVRRRLICESCPLMSLNLKKDDAKYQKLFDKPFETDSKEKFCGVCKCPINIRTSSLSASCGLETYNNSNTENKQPLKWESFKTN